MQCKPHNRVDRNHTIDFLKGICIIFVIITHYGWTDEECLRYLFPFWIDMAVPFFMAISGYVYSKSYIKHGIDSIGNAYTYRNIYNKIVRYTVPFVIAYVIELIFFTFRDNPYGIDGIESIIINFIDGGIGPGSYYYPVMLQLVFSFPLIFFAIRKYDFKGLIGCWVANGIFEVLQRAYGLGDITYRLLLYRYIFIIAVGCYIAIGNRTIKKAEALITSTVGFIFIVTVCYLKYTPRVIIYWTRTSFVAVMYIVPIVLVLFKKNIKCKLIELFGKASYNIFLTQMVYYALTSVCGGG